jgi:hypothetical protein
MRLGLRYLAARWVWGMERVGRGDFVVYRLGGVRVYIDDLV